MLSQEELNARAGNAATQNLLGVGGTETEYGLTELDHLISTRQLPPRDRSILGDVAEGATAWARGTARGVIGTLGSLGVDAAERSYRRQSFADRFSGQRAMGDSVADKIAYGAGFLVPEIASWVIPSAIAAKATKALYVPRASGLIRAGKAAQGIALLEKGRRVAPWVNRAVISGNVFLRNHGEQYYQYLDTFKDSGVAHLAALGSDIIQAGTEMLGGPEMQVSRSIQDAGVRRILGAVPEMATKPTVVEHVARSLRLPQRLSKFMASSFGSGLWEYNEEVMQDLAQAGYDYAVTGDPRMSAKEFLDARIMTLPMIPISAGMQAMMTPRRLKSGMVGEYNENVHRAAFTLGESAVPDQAQMEGYGQKLDAVSEILKAQGFNDQDVAAITTVMDRMAVNAASVRDDITPNQMLETLTMAAVSGKISKSGLVSALRGSQNEDEQYTRLLDYLAEIDPNVNAAIYDVGETADAHMARMGNDVMAQSGTEQVGPYWDEAGDKVRDALGGALSGRYDGRAVVLNPEQVREIMPRPLFRAMYAKGRVTGVSIGGQNVDVRMDDSGAIMLSPHTEAAGALASGDVTGSRMLKMSERARQQRLVLEIERAALADDAYDRISTDPGPSVLQDVMESMLTPEERMSEWQAEQADLQGKARTARREARLAELQQLMADAESEGAARDAIQPEQLITPAVLAQRAEELRREQEQAESAAQRERTDQRVAQLEYWQQVLEMQVLEREAREQGEDQMAKFAARYYDDEGNIVRPKAPKNVDVGVEGTRVFKSFDEMAEAMPDLGLRTEQSAGGEQIVMPFFSGYQGHDAARAFYHSTYHMMVWGQSATADDVVHEWMHHLVSGGFMPLEHMAVLQAAFPDRNGRDGVEQEAVVQAFMRYIRYGEFPDTNTDIASAFSYLKNAMGEAYQTEQRDLFSDDVKQVFDGLFMGVKADEESKLAGQALAARMSTALGQKNVDVPYFAPMYHGTPHQWMPELGFPHGRFTVPAFHVTKAEPFTSFRDDTSIPSSEGAYFWPTREAAERFKGPNERIVEVRIDPGRTTTVDSVGNFKRGQMSGEYDTVRGPGMFGEEIVVFNMDNIKIVDDTRFSLAPSPSQAREVPQEVEQAEAYIGNQDPLKLVRVRDDGDLDTDYIPGTHLFRTQDGDLIAATREDGQWDLESVYDSRVSTFDEGGINNRDALERLGEELSDARQKLFSQAMDDAIDLRDSAMLDAAWRRLGEGQEVGGVAGVKAEYRFIEDVENIKHGSSGEGEQPMFSSEREPAPLASTYRARQRQLNAIMGHEKLHDEAVARFGVQSTAELDMDQMAQLYDAFKDSPIQRTTPDLEERRAFNELRDIFAKNLFPEKQTWRNVSPADQQKIDGMIRSENAAKKRADIKRQRAAETGWEKQTLGDQEMIQRLAADIRKRSKSPAPIARGVGGDDYAAAIENRMYGIQASMRKWRSGLAHGLWTEYFSDWDTMLSRLSDGDPNSVWETDVRRMLEDGWNGYAGQMEKFGKWLESQGLENWKPYKREVIRGTQRDRNTLMFLYLSLRGNPAGLKADKLFESNSELSQSADGQRGRAVFDQLVKDSAEFVEKNPSVKKQADIIDSFMKMVWPQINEIYTDLYVRTGRSGKLGKVENYFPMMREGGLFVEDDVAAMMLQVNPQQIEQRLGQFSELKRRTSAKFGNRINTDVVNVFRRYMAQTAVYIGKQRSIENLGAILASPDVQRALSEKFGPETAVYRTLRSMLENERHASGRSTPLDSLELVMRGLRTRYTLGVLAANVPSIIRQSFSGAIAAGNMPGAWAAFKTYGRIVKYIADSLKMAKQQFDKRGAGESRWNPMEDHPAYKRMVANGSRQIVGRFDPGIMDMAFYTRGVMGKTIPGFKIPLWQALMIGQRWMDTWTRVAVWNTAYDEYVAVAQKMGKSPSEAHEYAKEQAERVAASSQPPATPWERIHGQSKSEFARASLMFTGQVFKILTNFRTKVIGRSVHYFNNGLRGRKGMAAMMEYLVNGGENGEPPLSKNLFFWYVVNPMLMGALARGKFPPWEKPEDWFQDMMLYNMSAIIPVVGPAVAFTILHPDSADTAAMPLYAQITSDTAKTMHEMWLDVSGQRDVDWTSRALYLSRYGGIPNTFSKAFRDSFIKHLRGEDVQMSELIQKDMMRWYDSWEESNRQAILFGQ